jgi:hypothetical protein
MDAVFLNPRSLTQIAYIDTMHIIFSSFSVS